MNTSTQTTPASSAPSRVTVLTRALDAVDRAHARAATVLHDVRNELLTRSAHAIDRVEQLTTTACERARVGIERADVVSADVVNRAQGVVGQAIEKARTSRSEQAHVVS